VNETRQREKFRELLTNLPQGITISSICRSLGLATSAFYQLAKGTLNVMTEDRAQEMAEIFEMYLNELPSESPLNHPRKRVVQVDSQDNVRKIKIVDPVQDVVIMTADRREAVEKELERLTDELRRIIDEMKPLVEEKAKLEDLAKNLREVFIRFARPLV